MSWSDFFRHTLSEAEQTYSKRTRQWHVDDSPVCLRRSDGTRLINFATNDYLGLRHDARLASAAELALQTSGVGAGASPLVSGYNLALAELESRLAAWQGTQAALVFSSGLAMNIGVVSALVGSEDLVLSDRLNHASLIDGCRLSGAHKRIYEHCQSQQVRQILEQERGRYRRALVVTESIFSMDGDQAPLGELQDICQRYDAGLLVDEAHATGVYGPQGAGLGELFGGASAWLGKLGTLSKAIGTCGGYVAGSRELIEFLVNRCRSYIFSTAIAPPVAAATNASIQLIPQLEARRVALRATSNQLRQQIRDNGWPVPAGDSPIIPIVIGDNHSALELSRRLHAHGLLVPAIRPPTVPEGTSRLRVSLCAMHSIDHTEALVRSLGNHKSQG